MKNSADIKPRYSCKETTCPENLKEVDCERNEMTKNGDMVIQYIMPCGHEIWWKMKIVGKKGPPVEL